MNGICVLLLLALVSAQAVALNGSLLCINDDDYSELERSLLHWPQNLHNLSQAFFPPNHQASISVRVTYHFVDSEYSLQYLWVDSSINMLIRSDLLRYLSLFLYNVPIRNATVTLHPLCDFESDWNLINSIDPDSNCGVKTSNDSVAAFLFLNTFTTNVSQYHDQLACAVL